MKKLSQLIYDDVAIVTKKIDLSQLDKKTILITGATGLIGTYFIASISSREKIIWKKI